MSRYFSGASALSALALLLPAGIRAQEERSSLGSERAIRHHLRDGDEFLTRIPDLIRYGRQLFTANWTAEDGGGRPLSKGTGAALSDPSAPLRFPRNFNRISAPDANSCAGCHNLPYVGGGGDIATNVFVLGQRFDALSFDRSDSIPLRGSVDERGRPVTLDSVANSRNTLGMFGAGYIEMLARQITSDLQAIRNSLGPGDARTLVSKGFRLEPSRAGLTVPGMCRRLRACPR